MVRLSTSESNPDGGGGGEWLSEIGGYHFVIDNVSTGESSKGTPELKVLCRVLAGNVPAMVNRKFMPRFYLTPAAADRLAEFSIMLGLLNRDFWKAEKEAGRDLDIDENDMLGMQFCAEVELKKGGDGKEYINLGWKTWSPRDPKAKHITKDEEAVAMLPPWSGGDGGNGNGNGNAPAAPTGAGNGSSTTGAPSADPFAALGG